MFCQKQVLHQYVYEKPKVSVQTDHKPLESILKKPLCKAPPRLKRLMLRLQPYDLDVHYGPGKYIYLADTLSRACTYRVKVVLSLNMHRAELFSLVVNIPVKIRQATEQDSTLRKVKDLIVTGWPKSTKVFRPKCRTRGTSEMNSM